MARTVNELEYRVKRNEILDVAQQLVATKGYARMSIQDILDRLQISKGAFYYYFSSKQALLEALAERLREQVEQTLIPIVQNTELSALHKLNRFFAELARWKTTQKSFLLLLIRVWYTDDNAVIRQKVRTGAISRITPLLTQIVRQGLQEGVLAPRYPERVGEVVIVLIQDFNDALSRLLLEYDAGQVDVSDFEETIAAYADALERILGAPADSLEIAQMETVKDWLGENPNDSNSE
jgi:AcrR family transcriptional regulator